MLKFYCKNIWFYLKIAWYKYIIYLAMALPVFVVAFLVVVLLRGKLPLHIFNVIVLAVILSPVIIALLVGLALGLKWAYLTIYSLRVHRQESFEWGHIWYRIYKRFTSPKILLALFLFPLLMLLIGYLVYTQVVINSLDAVKVGITLILCALLILVILNMRFLAHVLHTLWDLFTGVLGKLLLLLLGLLGLLVVFIGIYGLVTLIINVL